MPPELVDLYGVLAEDIREVLFTEQELRERVAELGRAVSREYAGLNPLFVGVLRGVLFFMADLLRSVTIPVEMDFIAVSSFSPETRDRGVVKLVKDLEVPITGRHVLFVEDVVDTGLTLNYILNNLRARQPASLEVCVLFNKLEHRLVDIPLKFKGFDLPDRFVVGYGLDHRERYRNLPFVGVLKAEALMGGKTSP